MKLEIDIKHAASGPYLFASGKSKPDRYRFERVKGSEHIHRLVVEDVNGDKAVAMLEDLGLRLQQLDVPVTFRIVVEDKDLDGADAIEAARAEAVAASTTIERLENDLATARKKKGTEPKAETTTGITDEQVAMLTERDEMIELLKEFAEKEEDTPVTVLARIVEAHKKASKKK